MIGTVFQYADVCSQKLCTIQATKNISPSFCVRFLSCSSKERSNSWIPQPCKWQKNKQLNKFTDLNIWFSLFQVPLGKHLECGADSTSCNSAAVSRTSRASNWRPKSTTSMELSTQHFYPKACPSVHHIPPIIKETHLFHGNMLVPLPLARLFWVLGWHLPQRCRMLLMSTQHFLRF